MTPDPELRRRLLLPARHLRAVLAAVGADEADLPPELLDGALDGAAPSGPGAFGPDGAPHPAVAAGVALVVGGPVPRLLVRAGTPMRRRLTVLAVTGELGASLARDVDSPEPDDRPVEQSLFGAHLLGAELLRCLPPVPVDDVARTPARRADAALLLAALGTPDAPAGRELARYPAVDALSGGFEASLEVTVSLAPAGDRPGVVDRLLWVCAERGWWELRPDADVLGNPAVDVLPVRPADLPSAVAPLLAGTLAVLAAAGTSA